MRLVNASVRGVGRFKDTRINLAGKLIAIVGPNEAGKTSLLRALDHATNGKTMEPALSSRAIVGATSRSVAISYEIEPGDLDPELEATLVSAPATLTVTRGGDSSRVLRVDPSPAYKLEKIATPLGYLERMTEANAAQQLLTIPAPVDGEEPTSEQLLASSMDSLKRLVSALKDAPPSANDELRALAQSASALFADPRWIVHKARFTIVEEWLSFPDAGVTVGEALWLEAPEFAFFEEADQTLEASYEISAEIVKRPPAALANLCGLAGMDLDALLASIEPPDDAARIKLLLKANERLSERFTTTWRQATLSVHLDVQGSELKVLIAEADHEITVFNERSAGLRAFIALIAFVESGKFDPPPLLLIDEAEQHLHIDAQAELIEMLEAQRYASKVIYTTHSPACLPTDLGARVRVVEPVARNSPISRVRNNFWVSGQPGFSPLMMAMGAGAAAFTPARRAVLAEGATEMILLPKLLRIANDLEALPYQVAPGLSEAPKRIYPDLDLEAARVALLVDGDSGGQAMRKALLKSGIDDGLVVVSLAPNLELFVDATSYWEAANLEIRASNPGAPTLPTLGDDQRWSFVNKWCQKAGLHSPSKIAIAARLSEQPNLMLNPVFESGLKEMHSEFLRILSPPAV